MRVAETPINKGFQDTENGFVSNARKYAKNKLTNDKNSEKKRSRFWFCKKLNLMPRKSLKAFFEKKRGLEGKN